MWPYAGQTLKRVQGRRNGGRLSAVRNFAVLKFLHTRFCRCFAIAARNFTLFRICPKLWCTLYFISRSSPTHRQSESVEKTLIVWSFWTCFRISPTPHVICNVFNNKRPSCDPMPVRPWNEFRVTIWGKAFTPVILKKLKIKPVGRRFCFVQDLTNVAIH